MKVEQGQWTEKLKWNLGQTNLGNQADLVLIFGETSLLKERKFFDEIKEFYPKAHLFGCSTSGEIYRDRVYDDTVTTTAIHFEKTRVSAARTQMSDAKDSYAAGKHLASQLDPKDLSHVLVFSIGLNVNGTVYPNRQMRAS